MKFNLTLFILFLLFSQSAIKAEHQVRIFNTYEDYKNQTGEVYQEYMGHAKVFKKFTLKFLKNKKIVKIKCAEIWGFVYKDALFRIDQKHHQPARLFSSKKICYYENGLYHLNKLKYNQDHGNQYPGFHCFFSKTIESDLVSVPLSFTGGRGPINTFKRNNPEYKYLFKCIKSNYQPIRIRRCLQSFLDE